MVKLNFITVFSTLNLIAVSPTCFITVIIIHCAAKEECCERSNRYGIEYNARNDNWKFIFNTYRTISYNLA